MERTNEKVRKDKVFIECFTFIVVGILGIDILIPPKRIVSFDDAKRIISMSIPVVEIEDKAGTKRNNLVEELMEIKRYVLGVDSNNPREIVRIQLGLNSRGSNNRYAVKTNVEGLSSIYCIGDDRKDKVLSNKVLVSGDLKITNETDYNIDVKELINEPLAKKFNDNSKVLIYHTHTNESYIRNESEFSDISIPPRSSDEDINVLKVGQELNDELNRLNIKTIHSRKYHNVPSDRGAYARSLATAKEYINNDPSIKITLDIHRDGISDSKKLRIVENVDGVNVAKIMIVVGTDKTGLSHDRWRENLKFALKLQKKLIEYNPNIVKPIFISKNRYNQHLTDCSLLIEIGGDGNIIDESIKSAKYVAKAISDIYCENKQ